MTLIVGLEGIDGLILASDSRGTIGDPRGLTAINDIQKKLFKLSLYCSIGITGSSELAAKLVDGITGIIDSQKLEYVDDILAKVVEEAKKEYFGWFGQRQWVTAGPLLDSRPPIAFTIIGYHKRESDFISRIYLLTSQLDFAPQLCPSGFMLTGIPQYATYLLHRLYDRRMNIKNLSALAAYLISETATQDPKVGGPIRIVQITKEDGYKELTEDEVNEINKRNEEQNLKLRKFFFRGE